MTVAALSDIHSNHPAFLACIQEALRRGAEGFVFLGDYVSDCAYPQRTLETIYGLNMKYPCRIIRGNREEYMTDYRASGEKGWKDGSSSGSLLYTYENISSRDLDWFAGLNYKGFDSFPGCPPLAYCHGSFRKTRDRLLQGDPATKEMLNEIKASMVLCGHIHRQVAYTAENGTRVVSVGSVGMANGIAGCAQMALLHYSGGTGWQEELLSVEYDVSDTLREIEECGLAGRAPVWVKMIRHQLLTGENKFSGVMNRACELCRESTGKMEWPDVAEKYWEQAAAELL